MAPKKQWTFSGCLHNFKHYTLLHVSWSNNVVESSYLKKSIIVAIIGRQTTKSRAYNIIIIKILSAVYIICTIIRNLDVNNMWPPLRLWIIIKGSWVTLAITVLLLYLCTTFALIPSVRLGVLCALPASAKANLQNWITVKTNFKVKATTSK